MENYSFIIIFHAPFFKCSVHNFLIFIDCTYISSEFIISWWALKLLSEYSSQLMQCSKQAILIFFFREWNWFKYTQTIRFLDFFLSFFLNLYVHLYSFNDIFKQSCFPRKIFQKKIRIRKQKVPLQLPNKNGNFLWKLAFCVVRVCARLRKGNVMPNSRKNVEFECRDACKVKSNTV